MEALSNIDNQPKISIIVPFYNEAGGIEFVLSEILQHQPNAELIAVDDGSSDATWELIANMDNVKAYFPHITIRTFPEFSTARSQL